MFCIAWFSEFCSWIAWFNCIRNCSSSAFALSAPTFTGLFSICWIRCWIADNRCCMVFMSWTAASGSISIPCAVCEILACVVFSVFNILFALWTSCWNRSTPVPVNTSTPSVFHVTGISTGSGSGGAFGWISGLIGSGFSTKGSGSTGFTSTFITWPFPPSTTGGAILGAVCWLAAWFIASIAAVAWLISSLAPSRLLVSMSAFIDCCISYIADTARFTELMMLFNTPLNWSLSSIPVWIDDTCFTVLS